METVHFPVKYEAVLDAVDNAPSPNDGARCAVHGAFANLDLR